MASDQYLIFLRDFSTLFMELASAIFATIYYYKYKNSVLKYFLWYLWICVLCEYSGYIMREFFQQINNGIIFNLFFVYNFLFIFYLYKKVLKGTLRKKIMTLYSIFYTVVFIVCCFTLNALFGYQSISFFVGAFGIILGIFFYFYEILNSQKVLNVKRNLLFWISIGLLIFYVGSIPLRVVIDYYANISFNVLFSIIYILIIIQNICYIIGFIWSDKKQPY